MTFHSPVKFKGNNSCISGDITVKSSFIIKDVKNKNTDLTLTTSPNAKIEIENSTFEGNIKIIARGAKNEVKINNCLFEKKLSLTALSFATILISGNTFYKIPQVSRMENYGYIDLSDNNFEKTTSYKKSEIFNLKSMYHKINDIKNYNLMTSIEVENYTRNSKGLTRVFANIFLFLSDFNCNGVMTKGN